MADYQSPTDGLVNSMSAIPGVYVCPVGQYVTKIWAGPSAVKWQEDASGDGNWIGSVSMLCSGGSVLTLDTVPYSSHVTGFPTCPTSETQTSGECMLKLMIEWCRLIHGGRREN